MLNIETYIYALVFFFMFLFLPLISKIARFYDFLDIPNYRKIHSIPIPPVGGIAIFVAALPIVFLLSNKDSNYLYLLLSMLTLVILGVIDDKKQLSVRIRVLTQFFSILILVVFGNLTIDNLGNIFGNGQIKMAEFSIIFTFLACIGIVNAVNLIDGVDGLATGITLPAISGVIFLSLYYNTYLENDIATLFFILLVAFLPFNLGLFGKKLKVFLGDSGSMLIGLILAFISIKSSQHSSQIDSIKPVVILWFLAIPILDTISIMIRRIIKKQSPFLPDRNHIHHIMMRCGLSDSQTFILITLISLKLTIIGIFFQIYNIQEYIIFLFFTILFIFYLLTILNIFRILKFLRKRII